MTTAILLAILLSNPNTLCHRAHAKVVVKAAKKAGLKYDIPPSLLLSVVVAETGCRNVVATGRGKGRRGCDVGYGQIHVPECDQKKMAAMLDPYRNLRQSAHILNASRNRCGRANPPRACRYSQWSLYNPGSLTWWSHVHAIWKTFRTMDKEQKGSI